MAASLHGAVNAEEFGVRPGAPEDQGHAFSRLLEQQAETGAPIFLPPGNYILSDIQLPRTVRLVGVPGATRILKGSGGSLFTGTDMAMLHVEGITLDGRGHDMTGEAKALLDLRRVDSLVLEGCSVTNSGASGLALEGVSGRIERCTLASAASFGLYSVQARGLRIAGNHVFDCSDGGILVHRWQGGPDATMVSDNRIERIGARSGGTGQYGNGINLYLADNVIVSGNHVSDCAFSAIRANSASNAQVVGNQCLRSGETAIYAEFAFEGTVVNSNLVDTAAIGISIANLDQGGRLATCQGNVVRNLVDKGPYEPFEAMGFGVGIVAEADTAITGNVVEDAARIGIQLGWGRYLRNVTAIGNMVRGTPEGFAVSVVDGVGAASIVHNVISGAKRAVTGYRWKEAVTGDLALQDTPLPPSLVIDGNLLN